MSRGAADPDRPHRYVQAAISRRNLEQHDGCLGHTGPRCDRCTPQRDDWSPCQVCGGSLLNTPHLLAPEPRRRLETVTRALAAWNEAAGRGDHRAMLRALEY